MKTRTSKKFTKRRTSKKKNIIPYVVGSIAIVGAGIGAGMLYKYYNHYNKKRVLVINTVESYDFTKNDNYNNFMKDKILVRVIDENINNFCSSINTDEKYDVIVLFNNGPNNDSNNYFLYSICKEKFDALKNKNPNLIIRIISI